MTTLIDKVTKRNRRKHRQQQVQTLDGILTTIQEQSNKFKDNAELKILVKDELVLIKNEVEKIGLLLSVQQQQQQQHGDCNMDHNINNDNDELHLNKQIDMFTRNSVKLNKLIDRLTKDSIMLKNLQQQENKLKEAQKALKSKIEGDERHEKDWLRQYATDMKTNYDPIFYCASDKFGGEITPHQITTCNDHNNDVIITNTTTTTTTVDINEHISTTTTDRRGNNSSLKMENSEGVFTTPSHPPPPSPESEVTTNSLFSSTWKQI